MKKSLLFFGILFAASGLSGNVIENNNTTSAHVSTWQENWPAMKLQINAALQATMQAIIPFELPVAIFTTAFCLAESMEMDEFHYAFIAAQALGILFLSNFILARIWQPGMQYAINVAGIVLGISGLLLPFLLERLAPDDDEPEPNPAFIPAAVVAAVAQRFNKIMIGARAAGA